MTWPSSAGVRLHELSTREASLEQAYQELTAGSVEYGARTQEGDRCDLTGGRVRGAVASEWTKLWSLRSTWWCLVAGPRSWGSAQ